MRHIYPGWHGHCNSTRPYPVLQEEVRLFAAMLAGAKTRGRRVMQTPGLSSLARWLDRGPAKCVLKTYLQLTSCFKELSWNQEFEADQVACALAARLRHSPEHMAAAVKVLREVKIDQHRRHLKALGSWQQELSTEDKRELAAEMGFPGGDFDAIVARYEAAAEIDDLDAMDQLHGYLAVNDIRQELLELAGCSDTDTGDELVDVGETGVPPDVVAGPNACPEPAVRAVLADMMDTHPPHSARLERIRHLSGQLPMLLRATAPPVAVGGSYSHASVAEQVAARLAARLRADGEAAA